MSPRINSTVPLDGAQLDVLYLPAEGHTVVLGTAGSGKSTLAIHRAIYLAHPEAPHEGKTLLVTYNRCLVTYLKHVAGQALQNITVENYHKFARGYLASKDRMRRDSISDPDLTLKLCEQAVGELRGAHPDVKILQRPVEFFKEEIDWIGQHGIFSSETYQNAKRIGRSDARVERADRPLVFRLYERYKHLRNEMGKEYDWSDISHTVLAEFESDSQPHLYKHIVIDEGQDLSPMELKSLIAAIPVGGSLTYFGDVAQQIYGTKMSWRSAGFQLHGRPIYRFEHNYRNTGEIAKLAAAIAANPSFCEDEDVIIPESPVANGPLPKLIRFDSEADELKAIRKLVSSLATSGAVAVLTRSRDQDRRVQSILPGNRTRLHGDLRIWPAGIGLYHGTYHAAKGLEFDAVVLPFLNSERLPHRPDVKRFGRARAESLDLSLLYVGVTRAKSDLVMTYSGVVSKLLPADSSLYSQEVA